jgi:hypothetical protein
MFRDRGGMQANARNDVAIADYGIDFSVNLPRRGTRLFLPRYLSWQQYSKTPCGAFSEPARA